MPADDTSTVLYAVHNGRLYEMPACRSAAGSWILQLPDGSTVDALVPWGCKVTVEPRRAHTDPLGAIAAWEVRVRSEVAEHEKLAAAKRRMLDRHLPQLHAQLRER